MKKLPIYALALAMALFLFAPHVQAAENEKAATMEKGEETFKKDEILTRLPNGMLVYIFKDARFPLACTRLYVRAGSATENPAQAGISHVLEHMVFKGTSHRPKGQVAKDVERLGGYLNAATSFDKTWYITDMPAEHWKIGMDVTKDMAFQASLDPKELESEKNVVISELQRGEDSPQRKLFENLQTAALKNTPYGRPIIGFEETIKAITATDLKNYVSEWYQPQNMMLLVGGDIEPELVLEHAQKLFGSLANRTDLSVPEPMDIDTAAQGSPIVEVERGPWNKIYMGLAIPVPGIRDLRSIDLDVLSYLLGGDGTSTLYQKYKYERQLVDSISVSNMSLSRIGMLVLTATLDADKAETFWNELTLDLAKLKAADFDAESITRAKFNLEDSMERAGETLDGLVSWKGTIQFELGGEQALENMRFTQRNVDQAQIQKAITSWLDSRQARVRVLAPKDAKLPDFTTIMAKNWPHSAQAIRADASQKSGKVENIDLENGCRLVLLPDSSAPYVSINLLMPGGNALLKEDQQGLADLTARLLTDGCGELNYPAMERWLAERAASASARAGTQTFGIAIDGPARFNGDYFGLLRNIIYKPRFAPQDFQREVDNMKAAIERRNDQPLSYMFSKVNPFLFPDGQPYGRDSLGTMKTLETFNAVHVRDFWTKQNAQPWVMAISGDFEREAVVGFAKSLPAPRSKKFEIPAPVWGDSKELKLELAGRTQAHLLQIFKTVPLTHPDAPALMLLQSILSGQSGILFTTLRDEQGLGYTVTAFNRFMPEAGFMAFYIGSTPDKISQSREGFAKIIEKIKKEKFPEEKIKAGANKLLGDYLRDRQSLASRSGEAATDAVLDYPQDFQKVLLDKAAALTAEDVRATAEKYLVSPYDVTLLP